MKPMLVLVQGALWGRYVEGKQSTVVAVPANLAEHCDVRAVLEDFRVRGLSGS